MLLSSVNYGLIVVIYVNDLVGLSFSTVFASVVVVLKVFFCCFVFVFCLSLFCVFVECCFFVICNCLFWLCRCFFFCCFFVWWRRRRAFFNCFCFFCVIFCVIVVCFFVFVVLSVFVFIVCFLDEWSFFFNLIIIVWSVSVGGEFVFDCFLWLLLLGDKKMFLNVGVVEFFFVGDCFDFFCVFMLRGWCCGVFFVGVDVLFWLVGC